MNFTFKLDKDTKLTVVKTICYRLFSSLATFLLAFLFTGNILVALSLGAIDILIKLLSFYFFERIWNKLTKFEPKPAVIWLTGLSGSGKTTIAQQLKNDLNYKSVYPVILDGDDIRRVFKQQGFDEETRKKHNLNVGFIASLFEKQGNIVIVSLISPYADIRYEVRELCSNFIEVYLSTDINTCIARDPKGLYKKAITGEIKNFTGISAPYEPPLNPELKLDTSTVQVRQCSKMIIDRLRLNK